jgi:2-methylfumaryl-CoA isomerase
MVVAITPRQWSGLVEALGLDAGVAAIEADLQVSLATDEGLRFAHRHRLFALMETAVAAHDADPLIARFETAGVCWEPYQTLKEAVAQDHRLVVGNPLFQTVTHPGGNTYPTPRGLARTGDEEAQPAPVAPRLGQHTEQVLAEHLSLSDGAIGDLLDKGIVSSA